MRRKIRHQYTQNGHLYQIYPTKTKTPANIRECQTVFYFQFLILRKVGAITEQVCEKIYLQSNALFI